MAGTADFQAPPGNRQHAGRRLAPDSEPGHWHDPRGWRKRHDARRQRTETARRTVLHRGTRDARHPQRPARRVPMKRLGILLSGRGSNFEAIADQVAAGRIDAEIAVVISSRPEARGLDVACRRGLKAVCIASKGLDREAYDRLLIEELEADRVDLVCLAGFMRLLSASFVRAFPQRVLNIHPSLLPAFPGLDAQKQALEHGVKITGCTVHLVD